MRAVVGRARSQRRVVRARRAVAGDAGLRAFIAVLVAMLVGAGAVADASTGRGAGIEAATKATTALAVVAVAATALAVTRLPRALPFAGAFAALAWMVALTADEDRWWAAPVGGMSVVVLLLIAAPTEARLDGGMRRAVVFDRARALFVGAIGAGLAALIAGAGAPSGVATGAWGSLAALVVLAVVLRGLLRRVTR